MVLGWQTFKRVYSGVAWYMQPGNSSKSVFYGLWGGFGASMGFGFGSFFNLVELETKDGRCVSFYRVQEMVIIFPS